MLTAPSLPSATPSQSLLQNYHHGMISSDGFVCSGKPTIYQSQEPNQPDPAAEKAADRGGSEGDEEPVPAHH